MSAAAAKPTDKFGLSGPQKCAIVCMVLGPKEAGKLMRGFSAEERERVATELMSLPPQPPEVVEAVMRELRDEQVTGAKMAKGGPDFARRALSEAIGPAEAEATLERLRDRGGEVGLDMMRRTSPEMLAGSLRWEHPQTAAVALAHLEPAAAAKVLASLETELATEVLARIATLTPVESDLLEMVGLGLGGQAELTRGRSVSPAGGSEGAAKLLNLTPRALQDTLLAALSEKNDELTGKIRAKMFTFEDLLKIDQRGIQRILREVEAKELAYALKAASEELKKLIKSNMSERAAETLEEEIELLGPVRARDVEASHARILETVRRLEEEGEIMIQREGESDDIIT